jgi:nucleotide-binding universal stress UspA family protein
MTMQEKYLSKILVAIDGSTPSMHAADYAISIAIKYGSQLIALYVIDPYRYPYLPSSIILAPTFGSEKYMEERNNTRSAFTCHDESWSLVIHSSVSTSVPSS